MTPDDLLRAIEQAKQREESLARRLDVSERALVERQGQLAAQQSTWVDLRTAEVHFEGQRLAQAARHLNGIWAAERRRSTPIGRLRQRLQDAHLPLQWLIHHPLRFATGVARLREQAFRLAVAELAESRLFDAEYYRAVTGVGPTVNIVARFLLHGDAHGEPPHPLFDPGWYRLQNPDLAEREPLFRHYMRRGGWELRSPHPLFDPRHYLSQFPQATVHAPTPLSHFVDLAAVIPVSPHPLFDIRHYLNQEPDLSGAGGNVLRHYLAAGAVAQLDPHPLFATCHYIDTNGDLRGRNPLDHFVRQGAAEGRSPHPLFDVRYYWAQRPVVRTSGGNALLDYLERALDDDLDPHPLFDTSYYLQQAPWVRALGLNPLVHFLQVGGRDGLRPNPWFDPQWYLEQNPDVVDVNPLLHFAGTGWKEGRDPSPDFSLSAHLAAHPDVAASGENPLEHHLRQQRGGPAPATMPPRLSAQALPPVFRVDARDVTGEELVPTLAATVSQHTEFRVWMDARGATPVDIEASVRALREQLYTRWSLDVWVAADAPPMAGDLSADPRIRIRPMASTESVPHVSTDQDAAAFAGWLSAGDELAPHALLFAAHAVQGSQPIDLVYADEDTSGPSGLIDPVFKPDWDPLLFESVDYLGSTAFIRLSRLRAGLAAQAPVDGPVPTRHTQLRRALRGIDSARCMHLPYVLVRTSPAHAYAARATGVGPMNLLSLADVYEQVSTAAAGHPLVSIVIPTRNGVDLLSTCVDSILGVTRDARFELLVVDNGSDDPACLAYLTRLDGDARCRVIRSPGPFNFSRLNNLGATEARGEILCLLNNDIQVTSPDWLGALVAFATRTQVGAVGSILRYPDGAIQHGGVVIGVRDVAAHAFVGTRPDDPTYMNLATYPREVSAVTGACLVVARDRYLEVGGLDEQELPVNFNDVDLCLKLRARGYRNVILPLTGLVHHESATRGQASASPSSRQQLEREALVMKQRWGASLRRDPYYSEHLAVTGELHTPERGMRLPSRAPGRTRAIGTFTALGREPRLDIYAGISNAARAAQATRARPAGVTPGAVAPGLSVVILSRDAPELVAPLVAQLASQQAAFTAEGLGFEAIIGDTGSTDPDVLALYGNLPDAVRVVRGLRYNFSRCNNALEEVAAQDTVLFLNNDVILPPRPDVLLQAHRLLVSTPGLGVLGSVLYYPDGSIQHMGCDLLETPQRWGLPFHVNARSRIAPASIPSLARVPGVTGAFLMIRRALFRDLGGFDRLYAAECQDIALCLEARRLGFDTACAHLGPIVHIENATRPKGEENWSDRQRFLRKYGAFIRSLSG